MSLRGHRRGGVAQLVARQLVAMQLVTMQLVGCQALLKAPHATLPSNHLPDSHPPSNRLPSNRLPSHQNVATKMRRHPTWKAPHLSQMSRITLQRGAVAGWASAHSVACCLK